MSIKNQLTRLTTARAPISAGEVVNLKIYAYALRPDPPHNEQIRLPFPPHEVQVTRRVLICPPLPPHEVHITRRVRARPPIHSILVRPPLPPHAVQITRCVLIHPPFPPQRMQTCLPEPPHVAHSCFMIFSSKLCSIVQVVARSC